ncbi:MAG: trypsin-like peptidase domain-containing protein [Selenomonadaceae bacterium]|nr:trypsin-like peptidase domain-containing protein [Selenomonadaceae bacterium]MBR1728796.1 trypsin-like peptidase domain-containing protein [Selenomonadaceae bacterium]
MSISVTGCTDIAGNPIETEPNKSEQTASTSKTEKVTDIRNEERATNSAQAATNKISSARDTFAVKVAKSVGPAVVGITNRAVARDFFNRRVESTGVGSGVIFRKDGYIVTNNHVIEGARELIVSLSDGSTVNGELVGADEMTDIAVVKIDAKDLPVATFGNSDEVVVGEPAIAIGNPMGLEFQGSVTVGVISALNRTLDLSDRRVKLFQTDAAISPGNSGGALANADGEVIAINSAKLAADGVEGMGFAIPINTVQTIIDELMAKGYVARPYLGVTVFDKPTAARYGYQLTIDKGVYVYQVRLDSPAGRVGLERGDIILAIDNKEVNSVTDLRNEIAEHNVGDKVKLKYERGGNNLEVEITLEEMPQVTNDAG